MTHSMLLYGALVAVTVLSALLLLRPVWVERTDPRPPGPAWGARQRDAHTRRLLAERITARYGERPR